MFDEEFLKDLEKTKENTRRLQEWNRLWSIDFAIEGEFRNSARRLETEKNYGEAIIQYENSISFGQNSKFLNLNNYAYGIDRVIILYRKLNRYQDEILAIERAIEIYHNENKRRFEQLLSDPKNESILTEILWAMENFTKVKKDGLIIFNPYPVLEYKKRKEKVQKLLDKQK